MADTELWLCEPCATSLGADWGNAVSYPGGGLCMHCQERIPGRTENHLIRNYKKTEVDVPALEKRGPETGPKSTGTLEDLF